MTQYRTLVSFFDITVQAGAIPGPHGVDEVLVMVSPDRRARSWFPLATQDGVPALITVDDQIAFRAVEDHTDRVIGSLADLPFMIGNPVPNLELQQFGLSAGRLRTVLVHGMQQVGRLLVVVEHHVSSHRGHLDRMSVDSQSPACDVELMDTLVSDVAVSVRPLPVPVVVETVARERALWGRTDPKVVMDPLRHRLVGRVADRVPPFVA